nr:unnamed protein product [Callosobruchus analis]
MEVAKPIDQTLDILPETESKVAIVSDSLSVLRLIQTSSPPLDNIHPIVRHIKYKLCILRNQGLEVVFIWVKAHTGILYNEKVDKLTKEAAQGTKHATHSLCLGDCINAIKKDILKLWQEMYQQYRSNTTTQYCSIQEEIPAKPWYKNINASRTYISMYSRLRFGHGRYPAFLATIGMADADMCEECHVPGTPDHIFFEWQKYYRQQEQFRTEMGKYGYHHPLNIVYVLSLNDSRVVHIVMHYLRVTGLQI